MEKDIRIEKKAIDSEKLKNASGGNTITDYTMIKKGICPVCGALNTLEPLGGGWHCTSCNHNIWI